MRCQEKQIGKTAMPWENKYPAHRKSPARRQKEEREDKNGSIRFSIDGYLSAGARNAWRNPAGRIRKRYKTRTVSFLFPKGCTLIPHRYRPSTPLPGTHKSPPGYFRDMASGNMTSNCNTSWQIPEISRLSQNGHFYSMKARRWAAHFFPVHRVSRNVALHMDQAKSQCF